MRLSPRTWAILSVLLLVLAVVFWRLGERRRLGLPAPAVSPAAVTNASVVLPSVRTPPFQLLTLSVSRDAAAARETALAAEARRRYPNQLTNTRKHVGQLVRSDSAILLQNALIETAEGTSLAIPAELRSQGEPGAYIVQARGAPDAAFRKRISEVGASIVSYIPNNAYLVRMPAPGAALLASSPQIQSVLPFEPYYKLDTNLLARAVAKQSLPEGQRLNVIGYPGEAGVTRAALQSLGAKVVSEQPTPFGQKFTVEAASGTLNLLAQSTAIQQLELWHNRSLLNDLARVRLHVATNTDAMTFNYVSLPTGSNLTGAGITVNVNDSGIDAAHPDLTGRVTADFGSTLVDFQGHGTHVAGTIASSGANSPMNMVSSNGSSIPGSASNANFRGIAYGANVYALPIFSFFGSSPVDYYLQTNAANQNYGVLMRTNPMVSNNSWGEDFSPVYNSTAASFDAAVRDALPEQPGMQPLIYVFAAGNSGFADDADEGKGGFAETVLSPGTAKNVVTVGAIENARFITNTAVFSNVSTNITFQTNQPFFGMTDTSNQVASFSSRGNVGIGIEGTFGRFKPDVVAPGTFTVSTRSSLWNLANDYSPTNPLFAPLTVLNSNLAPYYRYESGTSMAAPAVSGMLALIQEYFETQLMQGYSPALLKALLINGARTLGSFSSTYDYAVRDNINYQGWGLPNLSNSLPTNLLNAALSPMVLIDQSLTNALTTGQSVSYQLTMNTLNATNPVQPGDFPLRVTLVWTDPPGNPIAATKLVNDLDLVVSNVASGEVFYGNNFQPGSGFTVAVTGSNTPPVNDAINNVENVFINGPLSTNYVITVRGARVNVNALTAHPDGVAQDFALVISSDYNDPTGLGVQPFTLAPLTPPPTELLPVKVLTNGIGFFRERVGANSPLINSPVGSTSQWNFYVFTNIISSTGNQTLTNGTNVAFIIFFPPNISQSRHIPNGPFGPLGTVAPRNLTADVDLYVSTDPNLTNLLPAVLSAPTTMRSTNRGGNELVIVSNANIGDVYYVGVKAEDQQGGEFSLITLSTDQPFGQRDTNGDLIITALPAPMPIPDGLPELPSVAVMFGISAFPTDVVQRVVVSNTLSHDLYGDLFADVQHTDPMGVDRFAVLYNHNLFDVIQSGTTNFTFDDSGRGDIPTALRTDGGPGTSLNNFIGAPAYGVWQFTVSDNALSHLGQVERLDFRIQPRLTNDTNRVITLCAGEGFLDFVDVPPTATNLTVTITIQTGTQLEIYVRRDDPRTPAVEVPTTALYDKKAVINAPGGSLTLGLTDVPPLRAGRYYVLIFNPTAVCEDFTGPFYQVDLSLGPGTPFSFGASNTPLSIVDDAIMRSLNHVSFDNEIYSVEVGVRLDHPRVSDLALHLVSPIGNRVLLFENRGGTTTNGLGGGYPVTNVFPRSASGAAPPDTNFIPVLASGGTLVVDFDFFSIPDQMVVSYDGTNILDTGLINGSGQFNINFGPGLSTNLIIIMNPGTNSNAGTRWQYTARVITGLSYLVFTEDTNKTTTPIKFMVPPFGNPNAAINVPISDFEPAIAGDYPAGALVDGWTVVNQQVTVISNPPLAFAGSNLLALADAAITRTLPTIAGRNYTLQFAVRGPGIVSWWRGESNTLDQMGLNNGFPVGGLGYAAGNVGQAFNYDGVDDAIVVPASASLNVGAGSGMTIDAWIQPSDVDVERPIVEWNNGGANPYAAHFWIAGALPGGGGPGSLYANLTDGTSSHIIKSAGGLVTPSNYQHAALTYDKVSGLAALFLNGAMVAQSNLGSFTPLTGSALYLGWRPVGFAQAYYWTGGLDEVSVYDRTLSPSELAAINRLGGAGKSDLAAAVPLSLAKAQLSFDSGPPAVFFADNSGWQVRSFTFTAAGNGTTLDLTGLEPGMLLDSFILREQTTNLFVRPEESLDRFRGEQTLGDWHLELWDTRVGAAVTNGLISWTLQFVRADLSASAGANAVGLSNCTTYAGVVSNSQVAYFFVDVFGNATFSDNILTALTGSGMRLSGNRAGLPTGTFADDYPPVATGPAVATTNRLMTTAGFPPLLPGQRYYLAVENVNPNQTNSFTLTACGNGTPPRFLPSSVQLLSSGQALATNLAKGDRIDYYRFDASSNATFTLFELAGLNGNADLVVTRDADVQFPLPTRLRYNEISAATGTNNEVLYTDRFTPQVALAPGLWYLGVYNRDNHTVSYSVRATEYHVNTNVSSGLVKDVPTVLTVPGGTTTTNVYRFDLDSTNSSALFELFNPSGDADLFLGRDGFPSASLTRMSTRRGKAPEQVVVLADDSNPDLTGQYWLVVANHQTNAVSFTLRAAVNQLDGMLLSAQPLVANPARVLVSTAGEPVQWNAIVGQTYSIDVSSNLTTWTLHSTTVATNSQMTFTDPSPVGPLQKRFYRLRQVPP